MLHVNQRQKWESLRKYIFLKKYVKLLIPTLKIYIIYTIMDLLASSFSIFLFVSFP